MLTNEQVSKFQAIYQNCFGKKISREDAIEKGARLVRLIQIIYQPITKQELLEFKKRLETRTLTKINNFNKN